MMGRSHFASGIAGGLAVSHVSGSALAAIPMIVTMYVIGVMSPDLDCKGSYASKAIPVLTPILSWVLRHVSMVVYAATKGSRDEPSIGSHRHFTHTAVFAAGVSAGLYLLASPWVGDEYALVFASAFGLGCLTHDLGDSMTKMGCPFLWPLPIAGETWYEIKILGPFSFRTNGPFERTIVFPALCVTAFLLVPGVWGFVAPLVVELWEIVVGGLRA